MNGTITFLLFDKKCKKNCFTFVSKNKIENKNTKKIWRKFLLQIQDHEHRVNTTFYFVEHVNPVLNGWKHYLNKFLDQNQLCLH